MPIVLREAGNTFQEDLEDTEEEEEELRVSQLVFSDTKGLQLSQQLKDNDDLARGSSSEDGQEYLVSKELGSVAKQDNKNATMQKTGDNFAKRSSKHPESSKKSQHGSESPSRR